MSAPSSSRAASPRATSDVACSYGAKTVASGLCINPCQRARICVVRALAPFSRPCGLLQVPRDAPKGTDFAAKRVKGDGFGVDSVALGGPHGTRALQTARSGPKATADAVNQPKGDSLRHEAPQGRVPEGRALSLGALHGTRGLGCPEGDSPDGESVSLSPIRGTVSRRCREMPRRGRISPRNRSRATDSGPIPSPSAGSVAPEPSRRHGTARRRRPTP